MSWAELAVLALKLILSFTEWAKGRQQFTAGQDAEIAKTSAAILKLTEHGKAIAATLDAMNDQQVDDVLKDLEK